MDFIFVLLGIGIACLIANHLFGSKINRPELCKPSHTWRYDVQGLMYCAVCKRYTSEISQEGVER